MTAFAPLRAFRRLWPQKVRTRLAVIYSLLFLVSGSVLLGITYALVAASLPNRPTVPPRLTMTKAAFAQLCKKPYSVKTPVGNKAVVGGSSPAPSGASPAPSSASPAPSSAGPAPRAASPAPHDVSPSPRGVRPTPRAVNAKIARVCQAAYLAGRAEGSYNERQRALTGLGLYSLLGLGLMTVASGGAGWLISGRVLRPVRTITETARRASEQHLGERIALSGARDELKELADTFDDMLERLDQAFAAQRRFVADASHELRTPLTLMRTAIDVTLAKPGRTAEQLEAMAIRVRASIDRSERTIDALLTLAVSDQGGLTRTELIDLATAAEDAVDAATAEIDRLGLRLDSELHPAETTGDTHLLARMIGNLVDNAVRHNKPGGTVIVSSGTRDGQAFFQVSNTGPIIPPDAMLALFEPFHRLEGRSGSADGVGLGLAIARSIASAHMATLHAQPRPGGGLDVSITMPGREVPASG